MFQLANLRTNSRLRAVARLSGLRKALQPDYFEKCVDLIEIHGTAVINDPFAAFLQLAPVDRILAEPAQPPFQRVVFGGRVETRLGHRNEPVTGIGKKVALARAGVLTHSGAVVYG